ncbi:MAG: trypsin-like peptidase domain-containing protein [Kofleriaceae bacterium]
MRWTLLAVLTVACGGTSANRPHVQTAREIVDAASPAIVRVEAGEDRVGTGFIVDRSGLIATNLHVIEGESTIKVKLYKDEGEYQVVSIAGVDRGHDLALMRIKPRGNLPVVRLGDSSMVSAGDRIYAIGNPLGMDYSVSDGLISQVRQLSAELTILQISAPISQGSSGGPLFNQFGEVVGVTTMIVTQGQNINLAVPANYLLPMVKQQQAIDLGEFAKATEELAHAHGEGTQDDGGDKSDPDNIRIERHVPFHAVAVLDGCAQKDIEDIVQSIGEAIQNGAPLYNTGSPQGFEACYRIYEGTALKYEKDAACKGVRSAFGDGLLRASALSSYKEKAWAMRDAFDGLLNVSQRWAQQNVPAPKP